MKPSGPRHLGREYALRLLYGFDITGNISKSLKSFPPANWWTGQDRLRVPPPARDFGRKIVEQVLKHREEIDQLIKEYSKHWRLERISPIERNILRIGICELLYFGENPIKVILNEALELSKCYGNLESPRFINGILDPLASHLRQEE